MPKFIGTVFIIVLVLFIELQRHPGPEPVGKAVTSTAILNEQPSDQTSDDRYGQFAQWATTTMNTAVYWTLSDLLFLSVKALDRWKNINNPILRFLIFFGVVMGSLSVVRWGNGYLKFRKMALYCPECQELGLPIRGTQNRYVCKRSHRFNGDPHGFV